MSKGRRIRSNRGDDPMNDEITVICPSPAAAEDADVAERRGVELEFDRERHVLTEYVTRREFLGRLDGMSAADQVRAHRDLRVVALMESEAVMQWWATRSERGAQ